MISKNKYNLTADEEKNVVDSAMREIEAASCLKFIQGSNEENHYINITNTGDRCDSDIGYIHKVGQIMNFNRMCLSRFTAIHEFMHVLGFFHQHAAYNRNAFIRIIEKNVKRHYVTTLTFKVKENESTDFGLKYDYDSIMHYGSYVASKNGKQTIVPLQSGSEYMGQRSSLSVVDVYKINRLYHCEGWDLVEVDPFYKLN